MKKLAVFVEGLTERLFLERLVQFVAGERHIHIESKKASGGRRHERYLMQITATIEGSNEPDYYIQIVDSGSDAQVVSDIRERANSLSEAGFSRVLGLRDLRPIVRAKASLLQAGIETTLRDLPLDCRVVVAIVETETWFIGEYSHFQRIHASLTPDRVLRDLGISLTSDDLEAISAASETLNSIYLLEGDSYEKTAACIGRTIDVLDMQRLSAAVSMRFVGLGGLVGQLHDFFDGPEAAQLAE